MRLLLVVIMLKIECVNGILTKQVSPEDILNLCRNYGLILFHFQLS